MKRNYTGRILLFSFLVLLMLAGCKDKEGKDVHAGHAVQQYTCPMHPQVVSDKAGKCPVCGMDLVPLTANKELRVDSALVSLAKPVNERVVATIPTISAETGTRILNVEAQGIIGYDTRRQNSISSRVSGRIERLYIKYNFQPVKQGQLIMEIYSPDLAAAQREMLFVARAGDEDLLQKAKQRLSLLGMQTAQINQVLKTGNILYRVPVYSNIGGYILENGTSTQTATPVTQASPPPGNDGMSNMGSGSSQATLSPQPPVNENTPVLIREGQYVTAGQALFKVYSDKNFVAEFAFRPEYAADIRKDDKLIFRTNTNKEQVFSGTIGLIEPVVKSGQNFTLVRVYLEKTPLIPGQLIIANIPITSKGWWLPRDAVWRTGTRSIIFKKENDVFVPVEIQTGVEAAGMINVVTPVNDWEIAKNASFLVDSESFIKTKSKKD